MGRGDRRLMTNRNRPKTKKQGAYAIVDSAPPGLTVRRLALNTLVCTGAAVSALGPAHALTVGELSVDSPLGQPLNARIPVQLSAGEQLVAGCVTSGPAPAAGLGSVPNAVVSVPDAAVPGRYELRVSTARPLYEPMYELHLQLRCPGSAQLVRQYVLMLDLPGTEKKLPTEVQPATVDAPSTASSPPAARDALPAVSAAEPRLRARRLAKSGPALAGGTAYRVQAGDTLSTIAARISDRRGKSIWQLANEIFENNPTAFINANPDLIRRGAEISLPSPVAEPIGAPLVSAPAASAPSAPVEASGTEASTAETVSVIAPDQTIAQAVQSPAAEPLPLPATSTAPAVQAPVFQDEQMVAEPIASDATSVTVADEPASGGASPWLAALTGILIGAVASFLLLRERLVDALRGSRPSRSVSMTPATATAAAAKPPQFSKPLQPREPSMVVVEEPHHESDDEALDDSTPTDRQPAVLPEPSRASGDVDPPSEFADLFGEEPDVAMFDAGEEANLDLDLSSAAANVEVDQEIGWVDDLAETALTPTDQAGPLRGSGGDTVEQADLRSMSAKTIDDRQISDTLKEALDLLENDYEDELTASQVIDRAKLGEILDETDQEDTLIRTGTDQIPRR